MNILGEAERRRLDPKDHTVDCDIESDAFVAGAEWARKETLRAAAAMARDMVDNEPDGYYGQACYEVARAIESLAPGLCYQPSPDSEPRG